MAEFILPAYKGIEKVMQDVKVFARDKGIEKAIGLLPDGTRAFEVVGDAQGVNLPDQFYGKRGLFVVHGHPSIPTELSEADIKVITGMGIAGNMAVAASDDTVSWSHGIDARGMNVHSALFHAMTGAFMGKVQSKIFKAVDPEIDRRVRLSNGEVWPDLDERWVVGAYLVNREYVKSGFLRDYFVKRGEVGLEVLGRWLPKLGVALE